MVAIFSLLDGKGHSDNSREAKLTANARPHSFARSYLVLERAILKLDSTSAT